MIKTSVSQRLIKVSLVNRHIQNPMQLTFVDPLGLKHCIQQQVMNTHKLQKVDNHKKKVKCNLERQ